MRRCPYCAEDIAEDTLRCPHCGSDLRSAATVPQSPPAGVAGLSAAPSPTSTPWVQQQPAAATTGSITFSHTGQRYLLGYDATDFGIWDRSRPGEAVERFTRSDDGWSEAWRRYASLEPNNQPVRTAPPALAGPASLPWQQPRGGPVYHVPQGRTTNGLAVAALVLGIFGIPFFWLLAIPPALGLIFGIVSRGQIKASNGREDGEGMAVAGIALGIIGLVIFLVALINALTEGSTL